MAHRELKGKYYLGEGGKPMMREQYENDDDRPDYFLVLPELARKLVIEYMDVRSLRNMDMAVNNVYTLMAWHGALKGLSSKALNKWPLYQSTDNFKGLRWCMNRRVQVGNFKIWKVVEEDVEIRKDQGKIFGVLCLSKKYAEIASLMVRSGSIDPNGSVGLSGGWSPLHLTALEGRLDVAQALVDMGADIDKAMDNGCTSLYVASENGHVEMAKLLIKAGADIDKANNDVGTPLIVASQQGHVEVVRFLLKRGAEINQAQNYGSTPLYIASQQGHVEVVKILLEGGADINQAANDEVTSLFIASQQAHVDVVRVLAERGADVNKARDDGTTPLCIASKNGHVEVVEILLERGAVVDQADNDGLFPLFISSKKGYVEVVEILLGKGADNIKAAACFAIALKNGHSEVVELLRNFLLS